MMRRFFGALVLLALGASACSGSGSGEIDWDAYVDDLEAYEEARDATRASVAANLRSMPTCTDVAASSPEYVTGFCSLSHVSPSDIEASDFDQGFSPAATDGVRCADGTYLATVVIRGLDATFVGRTGGGAWEELEDPDAVSWTDPTSVPGYAECEAGEPGPGAQSEPPTEPLFTDPYDTLADAEAGLAFTRPPDSDRVALRWEGEPDRCPAASDLHDDVVFDHELVIGLAPFASGRSCTYLADGGARLTIDLTWLAHRSRATVEGGLTARPAGTVREDLGLLVYESDSPVGCSVRSPSVAVHILGIGPEDEACDLAAALFTQAAEFRDALSAG